MGTKHRRERRGGWWHRERGERGEEFHSEEGDGGKGGGETKLGIMRRLVILTARRG